MLLEACCFSSLPLRHESHETAHCREPWVAGGIYHFMAGAWLRSRGQFAIVISTYILMLIPLVTNTITSPARTASQEGLVPRVGASRLAVLYLVPNRAPVAYIEPATKTNTSAGACVEGCRNHRLPCTFRPCSADEYPARLARRPTAARLAARWHSGLFAAPRSLGYR